MNVLIYSHDLDIDTYLALVAAEHPQIMFRATADEVEALGHIAEADILVTLRPSNALLAKAKSVRWIQSLIAGTDYIEKLPAFEARKDIILTSSRGIHGPQVSELVILFMLALNRKFHQFVLNQKRRVWERWPTILMDHKKVAILGMGTIGQNLARKCKAFNMTVYGIGPNPKQLDILDGFYLLPEMNRVAADVDYFICTAPATPQNRQSLNAAFFNAMKPSAFFINVGRGEIIDEDALSDALRSGKIAGAGLDTFQREPLPADHPFWDLDNVLLTPHVGGLSDIYCQQAAVIFNENLKRYLAGERQDLINLIERK